MGAIWTSPFGLEGSGAFRRPGSSRHWADALGGSGSAHRAGWFKGSFIVSLRREAVFPKARGGRPPLAGRGSALRFRAGRGLCKRVVKAMTAGTVFPKAGRFRRLTAPRFYRSCAGALTEGLSPQSGLVQRKLYMLPAAAPHERKRTQPFCTTRRRRPQPSGRSPVNLHARRARP